MREIQPGNKGQQMLKALALLFAAHEVWLLVWPLVPTIFAFIVIGTIIQRRFWRR